jgi:hypothetical protein
MHLMRLARNGASQTDVNVAQTEYFLGLCGCSEAAVMQFPRRPISEQYGYHNGTQQDASWFLNDLLFCLGGGKDANIRSNTTMGDLFDIKTGLNWAPIDRNALGTASVNEYGVKAGDTTTYRKLLEIDAPNRYRSSVQELFSGALGWQQSDREEEYREPDQDFWRMTIVQPGKVLAIVVRRFSGETTHWTSVAVNRGALRLDEYIDVPIHEESGRNASSSAKFRLVSICEHAGDTLEGGHYTSMGRIGERWWKFDDDHVTALDTRPRSSSGAYILFYQRS